MFAVISQILNKLLPISVFLLVVINSFMVGALLYIVLPSYDTSFNEKLIAKRIALIEPLVEADAILVWEVNLQQNSRTPFYGKATLEKDQPAVNLFLDESMKEPFTSILNPAAVKQLIGGNAYCEIPGNIKHPAEATQHFRDNLPAKHICYFPIISGGIFNGYINISWKTPIPYHKEDSIVAYVQSTLKAK